MKFCYHCMHPIENEKLQVCPLCRKSLQIEHTYAKFLAPGTVLQGKYIVGASLGAGGFGNTYIGWNQLLLQRVAIKEFYPEQYSTRIQDGVTVSVASTSDQPRFQSGLQQFLEEARSIAALQNIKGVVKIFNFFEENGTGYIVMEYLEGMDVKTILKKSGEKREYEWCRKVILTVLHTLRDIHKRGVLHRDISPDNIFVTKEGVIKLIDFGAARHASASGQLRSEVVLKVGYAPIEQYSREAAQGAYTDLYAVAALFYRMVTGQKPIPANERLGIHDPLPAPSDMGIPMPEQAEMAMMVCLNVRPEYRLQSADEFMEALDGRYFTPVYDIEWIMPPVAEERQERFYFLSALPTAVKAVLCLLVIGLIGGMAAGGVALSKHMQARETGIESRVAEGMVRLEDYTGQLVYDVVPTLQRMGLQNIAEPVYDYHTAAEGTIIAQNIPASSEVSPEETLVFSVSGGGHTFTMPDFASFKEHQVITYFTDKNFDVTVQTDPYSGKQHTEQGSNDKWDPKDGLVWIEQDFSDQIEKGLVIHQSIPAGQLYNTSVGVVITCSMGSEDDYRVAMPDLTGKTKKGVKNALKKAGLSGILKVQYKEDSGYSDSVAAGNVLQQSIAPKKKVHILKQKGRKLTLYLSKGQKVAPKPARKPKQAKPASSPANPQKGQSGSWTDSDWDMKADW